MERYMIVLICILCASIGCICYWIIQQLYKWNSRNWFWPEGEIVTLKELNKTWINNTGFEPSSKIVDKYFKVKNFRAFLIWSIFDLKK